MPKHLPSGLAVPRDSLSRGIFSSEIPLLSWGLQRHAFSPDSAERSIAKTEALSKDSATITLNGFSSNLFPALWLNPSSSRRVPGKKSIKEDVCNPQSPLWQEEGDGGDAQGHKEANLAKPPCKHADDSSPGAHANSALSQESPHLGKYFSSTYLLCL